MQQQKLLTVLVSVLLLANLLWVTWLLFAPAPPSPVGRASSQGEVSFCINNPPEISYPCNTTASQNTTYYCELNTSDMDGNAVSVTRDIIDGGHPIFNVTVNGTINFTPDNAHVGNYTVIFHADDLMGCTNSIDNVTVNLTVQNINDPPYLIQNIPDQSFESNSTLSAFFLTDYFAVPDNDELNFTSNTGTTITATILPTSEVRFTGNGCSVAELFTFTATDPFNESADSNAVTVTVTCETVVSQSPSGSGGGSGGGGGGGNVCQSEWECEEWFACLPTDLQWRRCYDKNGCEVEKYLKRDCKYVGPPPECEENWLCSEWTNCLPNGTQSRSCSDLFSCGTAVVKPPGVQECVYIPTCTDGIQNGNETGVDCGGLCVPCAVLQQPLPITEDGFPWWIIVLLVLSVLLVSGVARYYRAEIAQAIAMMGFLLRHKTYKEILLSKEQRRSLFERLRLFETKLDKLESEEVYDTLGSLVRDYTRDALDLPKEALLEEVAGKCRKLNLQPETTGLVTHLFGKLPVIEQEEIEYNKYFVIATVEELRTLVCLTSEFEQEELLRPIEELELTEKMSFAEEMHARMTNILRAVQFQQHDIAKKQYVAMLESYGELTEDEKEYVYPDLSWVFSATKFESELTGARVVKKGAASSQRFY